jgi:hypothetical protein
MVKPTESPLWQAARPRLKAIWINPRSYLNWVVGEIERNQGDVDLSVLMLWHCPVGQIED